MKLNAEAWIIEIWFLKKEGENLQFVNTAKLTKGMKNYGDIPSSGELVKNTINVAWPSVLESFSGSLAGFVDSIMVGTLGSSAIAAVGLSTQPRFTALAFFFSLNVAVSAIVARRKGENDRDEANRFLKLALLITFFLSIIVTIAFIMLASPIITLMGSQPDTHELAVQYFQIVMLGTGFMAIQIIVNGAQRGAGNTRISMITNLTSNIVNVVFNYLLIGGNFGFPAMGIRGAALATALGSVVACVLSVISMFKKGAFISVLEVKGLKLQKITVQSLKKVWSSSFIEQLCMRVGFILFSMTVARLGTTELAAHSIGMNMMSMSFSFGDGFSVASVTLIGQSLGRKRPDLAKIYGNVCQKTGLICAFAISLVYTIFGKQIFSLFTKEAAVLEYAEMIMGLLSIALFMQIEQVVHFGCLRGAGDTKFTAFVSLISVTLIRPGISFLLAYPLGLGLMGAWLGTMCDQFVRFILSFLRFRKGTWMNLKL